MKSWIGSVILWSGVLQMMNAESAVEIKTLGTGQMVMIAEDKSLPVCFIYAVLRSGNIWDDPKIEGVTSLMGSMLLRGTTTRSREEIRQVLDQLGAEIDIATGSESVMVMGQTLKRNLDPFLEIFSDVILNPTFDEKELMKEKRETVADIKESRENDRALASRFFMRFLYGDHPYGMPPDGKESSVMKISRADVKKQYEKLFVQSNLFFAGTGDIDGGLLSQKLSERFQKLRKGKLKAFVYPPSKKLKGLQILLVDKPARTQTQMMLGHRGIDFLHPDFFPLLIANNAFGGGFTSTLMQEVRVKRGWSYGAYSWYRPHQEPGEFAMWVFPAAKDAVETLKLMLSLYERYQQEGISAVDFERSKKNLLNEFVFKIDTPKHQVGQLVSMELAGLPKNYLETYREKLEKVTLDEVNQVASKHATPQDLVIVVVGTARDLKKPLQQAFPGASISVQSYKVD